MKNMWNERFGAGEYVYGIHPNAFFRDFLLTRNPGHVLLAAEGEGRNALFALQQGWKVHAVDFSEAGKDKAMKLAAEHGYDLDYTVHDLAEWSPSVKYDVIALIYAHFPPEVRPKIHQTLAGALKPGGKLVLEAFNKSQLEYGSGGPRIPELLYSASILKDDFHVLEIDSLHDELVEIDEGKYHQGKAAVIRMIATRASQQSHTEKL